MDVQDEQARRRDLLLRALEACPDPEQALAVAVRMEQFVIDGQSFREKPQEATQPMVQPSSEEPHKKCNRSRWTSADDAHLHWLWQGNLSVEDIAQEIQRTPASIYARVRNLDLSSNKLRILDLSSNKHAMKNGARKVTLPGPAKPSPTANSGASNGIKSATPKINGSHKSKH